jgi:bisphosphoglycerate-independent phosphoglycerate mutase (AlkP superfamily)
LDEYFYRHPFTLLNASGAGVGLPEGQMGNSEVGHLTLGSGCTMRQDLVLIDDAVADGSFAVNPALSPRPTPPRPLAGRCTCSASSPTAASTRTPGI